MSIIDRKTFVAMLKNKNVPNRKPKIGKADWEDIYARLRKVKVPMTTTQIWDHYVEHTVSRFRTKEKLHEWADAGKCHRRYPVNKYIWYFQQLPASRQRDASGRFVPAT